MCRLVVVAYYTEKGDCHAEGMTRKVKDGETLEADMSAKTVEFEDQVEKDTAGAINKASKMGEQLAVSKLSLCRDSLHRLSYGL